MLLEEDLKGSVRYDHFKAPGRRFNGKVTLVRVALALSERRVVVYASSGRSKLVDSPYTSPHFGMVEIARHEDRGRVPRRLRQGLGPAVRRPRHDPRPHARGRADRARAHGADRGGGSEE